MVEGLQSFVYYATAATSRFDRFSHILPSYQIAGTCQQYATTPVAGCSARFTGGGAAAKTAAKKAQAAEEAQRRRHRGRQRTRRRRPLRHRSRARRRPPPPAPVDAAPRRRRLPPVPAVPPLTTSSMSSTTCSAHEDHERAAGNPILIGAVTCLITVIAVFLSYNANAGLPFVPTYDVKVQVPNAAGLVAGNEVRMGGKRVGTITKIVARKGAGGTDARAARPEARQDRRAALHERAGDGAAALAARPEVPRGRCPHKTGEKLAAGRDAARCARRARSWTSTR